MMDVYALGERTQRTAKELFSKRPDWSEIAEIGGADADGVIRCFSIELDEPEGAKGGSIGIIVRVDGLCVWFARYCAHFDGQHIGVDRRVDRSVEYVEDLLAELVGVVSSHDSNGAPVITSPIDLTGAGSGSERLRDLGANFCAADRPENDTRRDSAIRSFRGTYDRDFKGLDIFAD